MASKLSTEIKFKNRSNLEDKICDAVVELGKLAKVDFDQLTGPKGLSRDIWYSAIESIHYDPHFMGGPCWAVYAKTIDDVESAFGSAFRVADGFINYFQKQSDKDQLIAKSKSAIAIIHAAREWMITNIKKNLS